jgi:hypothetical protein
MRDSRNGKMCVEQKVVPHLRRCGVFVIETPGLRPGLNSGAPLALWGEEGTMYRAPISGLSGAC